MLKGELQKTRADLSGKFAAVKKHWRPVAILLAIVTWWGHVKDVWEVVRTAPLVATELVAVGTLVFLLLFRLAPLSGLEIIPRCTALLIDLLFLSMATFTVLSFMRHFGVMPNPMALMATLWLWFFYFVVFEAVRHGTPGKWLFCLEVRGTGSPFILKSFIRTSVSLLAPIVMLRFAPSQSGWNYSIPSPLSAALSLAIVSFGPMSVVFLGNARGIADRLAGTSVRSAGTVPKDLSEHGQWTRLAMACLMLFVTYYWASDLIDRTLILSGKVTTDAEAIAAGAALRKSLEGPRNAMNDLWPPVSVGLRNPAELIRQIDFGMTSNPMRNSVQPNTLFPWPYLEELKRVDNLPVIALTLAPQVGHVVKARIISNVENWFAASIRRSDLPRFIVLEFVYEEDFAAFKVYSAEKVAVCAMHQGSDDIEFETQPEDPRRFLVLASNRALWLMLGRVDAFEDWPIWGMHLK